MKFEQQEIIHKYRKAINQFELEYSTLEEELKLLEDVRNNTLDPIKRKFCNKHFKNTKRRKENLAEKIDRYYKMIGKVKSPLFTIYKISGFFK